MTRKLALGAESGGVGVSRGNARFAGVGAATFAHASHEGDEFFHWLAGFVDGEGCFMILPNGGKGNYRCTFALNVREDDAAIIREIVERTGIGDAVKRNAAARWIQRRPQITWVVRRKADTRALVALFDRYQLRAKKRHDYAIWREAVLAASSVRGGVDNGATWERIGRLRGELATVRSFA